jgi:hypothetical protein
MSDPERFLIEAVELVRRLAHDGDHLARRRRRKRRARRVLRGFLFIMLATFVIVPSLVGAGFWLGRHWAFALIAGPIVLVTSWGAILHWTFRRRLAAPHVTPKSDLTQLPAETSDWLEQERALLPRATHARLDAIGLRLESLAPQLSGMDAQSEGAAELRRLLGEELPELVRGYRKLPPALTQAPLYGGPTPEQQLIEGLDTVDKELGRLHERLAQRDLHALATHKRYLDLKYERRDEPE